MMRLADLANENCCKAYTRKQPLAQTPHLHIEHCNESDTMTSQRDQPGRYMYRICLVRWDTVIPLVLRP